jgi:dTDP-glucose 4,6-dehydratase
VKYFVTGGAGFIGSHYVDLLLSETQDVEQVTVYDKFTYAGNARNLEVHKNDSRLKVVIGDICNSKDVKSALTGHDVIVHFAAESHVDRSIQDSGIFIQTNVMGTYNLLETARLLDIKSFIHISTDEVYGSLESGSATEDFPLMPNSPYAASKASSDLLARSYFVTHGMDVRITRCSNNYGPRQFPEKVIPVLTYAGLRKTKMPIYGNGLNVREWIYVKDHCRGVQLVLEAGSAGDTYNIGSGVHLNNIELAREISAILKLGTDNYEFVQDRKGHDFRYSVDFEKLTMIGYTPRVEFKSGLEETVSWYRENSDWWTEDTPY